MIIPIRHYGKMCYLLLESEDRTIQREGYNALEKLCAEYLEGEDTEARDVFNEIWGLLSFKTRRHFVEKVTNFKSVFTKTPNSFNTSGL